MAQREYPNIHIDDYLALDQNSQHARYEYLDGELQMLAGGSPNHSLVTINISNILYNALADGPCLVYSSDMKLQLSESRYVYPDITVTCDPRDQAPEDNKTHYPIVVVEVLSPGTEMIDRGTKLFYYQAHPSIREYIMANSQSIHIEIYHREKGHWTSSTYEAGDEIFLESLGISFSVNDVYKKTSLLRK